MATLRSIGEIGRKMMLTAATLGTLLIGACGVNEPEENPWQDVSKFSWPQNTSTTLKYAVREVDYGVVKESLDTTTTALGVLTHLGQPMFMLDEGRDPAAQFHYLATADTLFVSKAKFGGDYLLVSPLDKGHGWVSGFRSDGTEAWKATIVDRLSVLKLNGIEYRNVVAVKYERVLGNGVNTPEIGFRYFAEGVGQIKETKSHYSEGADVSFAQPTTVIQKVLTSQSQN